MKKLRSSMTLLILTSMFSTMLFTPISASASERKDNSKMSLNEGIEGIPSMTMEEAVKLIENKYLYINNKNEFKISPEANKVIPKDILLELNKSINLTNDNIEKNNLTVQPTKEDKFNIKVENKFKEMNYNMGSKLSRASSFYNKYAYKYKFFWWGFAAWVNKNGTIQLITGLEHARDIFVGLGVASSVVGGLTVAASALGFLGFSTLITQAKQARDNTGSCITYCYGSPNNGQVYKITSSW